MNKQYVELPNSNITVINRIYFKIAYITDLPERIGNILDNDIVKKVLFGNTAE